MGTTQGLLPLAFLVEGTGGTCMLPDKGLAGLCFLKRGRSGSPQKGGGLDFARQR